MYSKANSKLQKFSSLAEMVIYEILTSGSCSFNLTVHDSLSHICPKTVSYGEAQLRGNGTLSGETTLSKCLVPFLTKGLL